MHIQIFQIQTQLKEKNLQNAYKNIQSIMYLYFLYCMRFVCLCCSELQPVT